jgi:hypothetical protein
MSTRLATLLATVTAAGALVPATAAQTRFEVEPLVALYAPLGGFKLAPYYTTSLPNSPGDLTGLAWGGQGRLWFTPQVGVQLEVASSASRVGGGNTPGGPVASSAARVLTASVQVLYNPALAAHRPRVWLSGGVGIVRHGGAVYAPYGAPVQFATALGFGSAIPLRPGLQANLGVTTLLYSIDVSDSAGTSLEHGFQVDPLIHAGLSWGWP